MADEPKMFPMLDGGPPLPWAVAEALYTHMYDPLYGTRQSLERIAERGGFGYDEIRLMAVSLSRRAPSGGRP